MSTITLVSFFANSSRWSVVCKWLLRSLAPSFLDNWFSGQPRATKSSTSPNASKVDTLDGLRGLACLFVFNEHYTYNFTTTFLYGYGVGDLRTTIQLPGIRLFWSGFSMVAIFFVISGYVLSYKPLRLIRRRNVDDLLTTLTSSVFRRALRLFLPPILAVLLCGLFVQLGVFRAAKAVWEGEVNYGLHETPPPHFDTFTAQMRDALKCSFWLLNFWNWSSDSDSAGDYDLHTWTMPVEFRNSMALFLVLVATARLRQTFRLLLTTAVMVFCISSDQLHVTMFFAGMLMAEIDMIRQDHASSSTLLPLSHSLLLKCKNKAAPAAWPALFVAGVYIASVPTIGCEETPGYVLLSGLVPSTVTDKGRFLRGCGAICITWSAVNSRSLEFLYTNPFSAYLGKISFALYLVHGNVLKSLLYAIIPTLYSITGRKNPNEATAKQIVGSWLLGLVVILPVTFWLSDIFWRAIDMPCVRLARWLENVMSHSLEIGEEPKVVRW